MPQALPSAPKRCEAVRKDGLPCRGPATVDGRWCFAHAPHLQAKRDAARRRGGHHSRGILRASAALPPDLRRVADTLIGVLDEVHTGALLPGRATAMATVARALVDVIHHGDLADRVAKLEAHLGNDA